MKHKVTSLSRESCREIQFSNSFLDQELFSCPRPDAITFNPIFECLNPGSGSLMLPPVTGNSNTSMRRQPRHQTQLYQFYSESVISPAAIVLVLRFKISIIPQRMHSIVSQLL